MTHDTIKTSLVELREQWCIDDVIEAHDVIDEIDRARAHARPEG